MGLTFRDGTYRKSVTFGKRTIKAGEAVAVWDMYGNHTLCIGPMLKRLFFSDIIFLNQYKATNDQFLIVEYQDGRIEHKKGPCKMWMDPLNHHNISVEDAILLNGPNELIVVVSSRNEANNETATDDSSKSKDSSTNMHRNIIKGPASYFPTVNEKVVKFNWSEPVGNFRRLRINNDFSCQCKLVLQENLDATLHLTLFFSVMNPLKLIDNSSDAIKDIMNALNQDITKFGATIAPEDLGTVSEIISDGHFPMKTLLSRAESIGLSISNIVLRNLEVGKALQEKYKAQEKLRCKISEQAAAAEQTNHLAALDITAKEARSQAERDLASSSQAHELLLAQEKHKANLQLKMESDEASIKFLKELHSLNVDLTKYMCAQMVQSHDKASKLTKVGHERTESESTLDIIHDMPTRTNYL